MKIGILLLSCALFAAAQAFGANAVPPFVNYQGFLADGNGVAIAAATKKLEFRIYDAATGTTVIWGPQTFDNVAVTSGTFNVILGSTDASGRSVVEAFRSPQRYLGIKVGDVGQSLSAVAEIVPRQQLLSTPFAMYAENGVPAGTVVAWYGNISAVPAGWALCDGADGTPDLRNRFIVGAGGEYAVSATGGSSTVQSHSHAISRGPHPSADLTGSSGNSSGYLGITTPNWDWGGTVGFGLTGNIQTDSVSSSYLPPYYSLAYIMKL